ncbi:MAG: hypothetical protein IJ400_05360 [Clostridia bacterium]|nr:hypothetical protein [Clostridia bacterium]
MKVRVVGWTHYGDSRFENDGITYAEMEAIVDDIKENGYMFTGMHHQGCKYCVPVLNDGKKRVFSERGFGKIMARGHDVFTSGGYVDYAFNWGYSDEELKMPGEEREIKEVFEPETDLNEEFEFEATEEQFNTAQSTLTLEFPNEHKYRYMSGGDDLTMKCGDRVAKYHIAKYTRVERHENLSRENEIFISTVKLILEEKK